MSSKIEKLKKKARKHYELYYVLADGCDCGLALAEVINKDMYRHKVEFNKTIKELREIDDSCPNANL